jgi:NitT/TauT family transport system permease protein
MMRGEDASGLRRYLVSVVAGLTILLAMSFVIENYVTYPEMRLLLLHAFSTVSRITITLLISIAWGVPFGILAATNKAASLIVTPIIDLLQSIPILGYFPLVIGFLFALGSIGIELSVIVLLFTSMAWAIFFGVVGAVRGIPTNVVEASRSFGFKGWKYTRHVVLPAITPALISGANLAWSDGWFFMIAAEYIQYKGEIVAPPSGGLGYLLARAAYFYKDMNLAAILLVFVTSIVIVVNSLTWHKLMERTKSVTFKPISLGLSGIGKIQATRMTGWIHFQRFHWPKSFALVTQRLRKYSRVEKILAIVITVSLVLVVLYVETEHIPSLQLIQSGLASPPGGELVQLPMLIVFTMGRLAIAYAISLAVAILLGVLAAEHRRLASVIYPIYDVGQGVPILALFPVLYLGLSNVLGMQRVALEITCIVMLVLDMIWYMFINITSAVKTIPPDMKEVGQLFGFKGLKRITHLIIPSILPAIVTGSILSWGTGWNTIIFSEYLPSTEPTIQPVSVPGIGSLLDKAGYEYGNTVVLVAILGVISTIVLLMEALIWRRLLKKFERYHVEV